MTGEREEEELGRGRDERGRDLPDHCQTTSYAPVSDCMGRAYSYTYLLERTLYST